jgi:hypothetical protein
VQQKFHLFHNINDFIWLQAKDIKIYQKSFKLDPCQLGSFKVIKHIGDLDFKLNLSHYLKLYSIFYINYLAFY